MRARSIFLALFFLSLWGTGCSEDATTSGPGLDLEGVGDLLANDAGTNLQTIVNGDGGSVSPDTSTPSICQCESNDDCLDLELEALPACVIPICDEKTCQCVGSTTFKEDGLACDDGSDCTVDTVCQAGECVTDGGVTACDDGNACTVDNCDGEGNCIYDALNVGTCDDGDACTLDDACADGECVSGSVLECDDELACTDDVCDPEFGCLHSNIGEWSSVCDDGNACTADACKPDGNCISAEVGGTCEDGDLCTFNDYCEEGECLSGFGTVCDDDNICTDDSCDPEVGCVYGFNNGGCDDGLLCNGEDTCEAGVCVGDTCSCVGNGDCLDDGNPCNGVPFCDDGGICQPGDPVLCDVSGDGPCAKTVCNTATGLCELGITLGADPCDDGDPCTVQDACSQGVCVGMAVNCGDDNPCVSGDCDPETGACSVSANSGDFCEDGDPCTDLGVCDGFECIPGKQLCGSSDKPCCGAHDEVGCNEVSCEACVCAIDSFCCDTSWDGSCAGQAVEFCFDDCSCATGCCGGLPGESGCGNEICEICVCELDPSCCTEEWTELCGVKAGQFCAGDCACPLLQGGDCCANGFGNPGCGTIACQDCVCDEQPFCCGVAWDTECVIAAETTCISTCGCATEPPIDCCNQTKGTPGCGDAACEDCVCAIDSTCCDFQWDASCMNEANIACQSACGCSPGSDCCGAKLFPGCDTSSCENCVCELDPICCSTSWDSTCATQAIFACGDQCDCPEGLGNSTGDCCAANGTFGCEDNDCELCVCNLDSFCCTDVWDVNCTEWASQECVDSCPCEPTEGGEEGGPDPEPGDCCETTEASGCLEESCEACVCAIAPNCCDPASATGWNAGCEALAEAFGPLVGGIEGCGNSCTCAKEAGGEGGTPTYEGACCAANETPGCEDATCSECVCGLESFCCEVVWDEVCAGYGTGASSTPVDGLNCVDSCACGG